MIRILLCALLVPSVCMAADFDPQRGRVHRGSLYRDGVFPGGGLPTSAKIAWSTATGGPVRSSPVVADGMVFVGSNDGKLYGLDLTSGAVKWSQAAVGPVSAAPTLVGDAVIVPSEGGALLACDPLTGNVRWLTKGYTRQSPAGAVLPFGDHILVQGGSKSGSQGIGMSMDRVLAFDPKNGKHLWQAEIASQAFDPLATDGKIVLSNTNDLQAGAFDGATGKRLWSQGNPFYARAGCGACMVGDQAILVHGPAGAISCVALADGKKLWQATIVPGQETLSDGGAVGHEIIGPAAVGGGGVFVGSLDGGLYRFALDKGDLDWRAEMGAPIYSGVALAGDRIYVGDAKGGFHCLKAADGGRVWSVQLGGLIMSCPWIGDGFILVGCEDGKLYCLK